MDNSKSGDSVSEAPNASPNSSHETEVNPDWHLFIEHIITVGAGSVGGTAIFGALGGAAAGSVLPFVGTAVGGATGIAIALIRHQHEKKKKKE